MRVKREAWKRRLGRLPGYRFAVCLKDNGVRGTREQLARRRRLRAVCPAPGLPPESEASEASLVRQAADVCETPVGVAADARDADAARRLMDSLRNQTHRAWTLCAAVADAAQEKALLRAARGDARVRCVRVGAQATSGEALDAALGALGAPVLAALAPETALHPGALWHAVREDAQLVFSDGVENGRLLCKPQYAPDTLRSRNDMNGWLLFSRGQYRPGDALGGMYGLALRLAERASSVSRIPLALYTLEAQPREQEELAELAQHLVRTGLRGAVSPLGVGLHRVEYELTASPLVSVVIPNRDQPEVLRRCLTSVLDKSAYPHLEIVVLENGSKNPETFRLYDEMRARGVTVAAYREQGPFNYARINNWGARQAHGDVLVFLNNDMEIITPDWAEQLLMFVQRPDVGAAGALLRYPDGSVQHAGIVAGMAGAAGHIHKHLPHGEDSWLGCLRCVRNVAAVTGACLMIRRETFGAAGGFDEELAVAFNDVDLCLRLCGKGYVNVFTPFAELYHHESVSRGSDESPENRARFERELAVFLGRWGTWEDPNYNPNLNRATEQVFLAARPVE